MAGFYGQFIDTVGMEYESTALNKEFVAERVMKSWLNAMGDGARRIKVTRDASIEFVAEWVRMGSGLILLSTHTAAARKLRNAGNGNTRVMGFELALEPMEMSEFEKIVFPMLYVLRKYGDFTSKRASVHYHYGFANNLRLLRMMLAICLYVEPVLYRLGGMGDVFRGSSNLAAYARPLMHSLAVPVTTVMHSKKPDVSIQEFASLHPDATAQELFALRKIWHQQQNNAAGAVEVDGRWVQIINPVAALQARTIDEFWACFGVNYPVGGTVKYHPSRYHGSNFFAVASHGTMEFRHFNQNNNPTLLVAVAKFLKGLVELSTVVSKQEAQMFEIVPSDKEISFSDAAEIVTRLMNLCHEHEIENLPTEDEMALILDTIQQSHFESLPETPVLCHIKDFQLDADTARRGQLKVAKKILEPKHIDIHNISEKDISIFD